MNLGIMGAGYVGLTTAICLASIGHKTIIYDISQEKTESLKNKNKIVITFQSKSFLQQQVRSMVGSLKYLGEGKWNLNDFKKAFSSKKRTMCAPPAPAHGLYLDKVKY